jgi:hypothetical protein
MRVVVVAALALAALVRFAFDWQASIGRGASFSRAPIGRIVSGTWPEATAAFIADWQRIPLLWNPLGEIVLGLPLTVVLVVLAAALWLSRTRVVTR